MHTPILLVAAAAGLALAQDGQRQDAGHAADVSKLYARNCASCHVPPDPDFAVDLAWITQLADTA